MTTVSASLQQIEVPPVVPPQPNPEPPPNPEPEPQPVPQANPGYLGVLPAQQQPEGTRGVVISGAQPGGPAARAGLKAYDTILSVNGQPAATPQDLRAMLSAHAAGEVVQIRWTSGNRTFTRAIRLTSPPAQAQITPEPPPVPSLRTPHRGVATFNVAHDHGQSGQAYCVGVLAIGNGVIYYRGTKSVGVGGVHNYEILLDTVKEAHRNSVYLVALGRVPHPHPQRHQLQLRRRQPTGPVPAPGRGARSHRRRARQIENWRLPEVLNLQFQIVPQ